MESVKMCVHLLLWKEALDLEERERGSVELLLLYCMLGVRR